MAARAAEPAEPARAGRRRRADQDPRGGRRLHRPRRPGPGPDGLDRPHRRGLGRPAALPLRHQGAPLRRGADATRTRRPPSSTSAPWPAPARAPPSGCRRSSTAACPATSSAPHEWLLWQELALLCIRDPHLAKVGAELYEDLYVTVADIVREGLAAGVFDDHARPEAARRDGGRPHRRPRRPGAGGRPQPRARAGAHHHRHHGRRPGRPRRAAPAPAPSKAGPRHDPAPRSRLARPRGGAS